MSPPPLRTIESAWAQIARRRILSCLLVVVLCLVMRMTLLRVSTIPEPQVSDEFSYILGAETFAKGRLTTPTHPMWRFFETHHVNMQPTYASKYPPAQAAFLALGIRFFGHPWYGVLISVALMCGCICWMLQGWMPPKYALLGGIFAVLQFGAAHSWIDSYWGGAVAALGGALVIGALPRLARAGRASSAYAAAFGIFVLANSRPFEGAVLVSLSAAALLFWPGGRSAAWLRPAALLPLTIILSAGAGAMAIYNWRLTGSPLTLPYSVNMLRYAAVPVLWILPPYPPKQREYRDPSMREMWESWDVSFYKNARRNPAVLALHVYQEISVLARWGAGLTLAFLFACALPIAALPRLRMALGILLLSLCAVMLEKSVLPHYVAPSLGVYFVVAMFGLRLLHSMRLGRRRIGQAVVAGLVAQAGVLFIVDTVETIYSSKSATEMNPVVFRRQVSARLESEAGTHLVLVHYAPNHSFHSECVYNSPDIDSQKIVWAFDFGPQADRPLLEYFAGRKVWLMQPDGPQPTLELYSR